MTLKHVSPPAGAVQQADDIHHRRLAGSRLPHDCDELTLFDLEVDPGQGMHLRAADGVSAGHVL